MAKNSLTPMVVIFLLVALIFISGAGFLAYRNYTFRKASVETEGTIVELIPEKGSRGSSKPTLAPVFTYTDRNGKEHKVKSSSSSYPPIGNVGDKIPIRYDPERSDHAMVDSFFGHWGDPLILGVLGIVFLLTGLFFLAAGRRSARRT